MTLAGHPSISGPKNRAGTPWAPESWRGKKVWEKACERVQPTTHPERRLKELMLGLPSLSWLMKNWSREVPSQSWQEAEPQELPTLDSAGMSRFCNSNIWSVFILNLFASSSSWVPLFTLLGFAYHLSLQSDSNTHLLLRIYKSELDICFRRARSLLRPILSPVPDSFTSILPASRFPVASTLGSLP